MPMVVHIKDSNKFPFVDRFHVKTIDSEHNYKNLILSTKDIDIATDTAKEIKEIGNLTKTERVIVTRETIIQMY